MASTTAHTLAQPDAAEAVGAAGAVSRAPRPSTPPPATAVAPVVSDDDGGANSVPASARNMVEQRDVKAAGAGTLSVVSDGDGDGDGGAVAVEGEGGGVEGLPRASPVAGANDGGVVGSGAGESDTVDTADTVDAIPSGSPAASASSSAPALAASREDGQVGIAVEGGWADGLVTLSAEEEQQRRDEEKESAAPGFRVGEDASLEANAEPLRTGPGSGAGQRPASTEREKAFGAAVAAGAPDDAAAAAAAAAPSAVTPLGRLVRLLGELADGGKVTLEHAVAALNGDGKALAVLVRREETRSGEGGTGGRTRRAGQSDRPLSGGSRLHFCTRSLFVLS